MDVQQYVSDNASLGEQLDNSTMLMQSRKLDLNNVPVPKDLNELVAHLRDVFSNNDVDVDYVKTLIGNYKSNPKDWRNYIKYDPHKYTRTLIDEGNGEYNILLLCWAESQGSSIHDHANSHCFMKCLDGEVNETKFEWPEKSDTDDNSEGKEMKEISSFPLKKNQVTYINDEIGLHRIENKSHSKAGITLHVYVPPFTECHGFDQASGKSKVCQINFTSKVSKN